MTIGQNEIILPTNDVLNIKSKRGAECMKLYPRKPRLDVFIRAERMEMGMELLHSDVRAEKKFLKEEGITPDMEYSDLSLLQQEAHNRVHDRLVRHAQELFDYINQKWEVQSESCRD